MLPFYGFDAHYLQTAICGSGKVVYGKGTLVAKRVLPAKTLERILQVIAKHKDTYLAYFDEGSAEPPLDVSIRPAWMIFGVTQTQIDYIALQNQRQELIHFSFDNLLNDIYLFLLILYNIIVKYN